MSNAAFLSYRRDASGHLCLALAQFLQQAGIDVFFDIDSIRQGRFDEIILDEIDARPYFLPVLAQGTLDRCVNDGDWVRREIEHALELGRTIVPIITHQFEWSDIDRFLPADTAKQFARWNGVEIPKSLRQFKYAAQDLLSYLVPITADADLDHGPVPKSRQQDVDAIAAHIASAPEVSDALLDANEEFERGVTAIDEARFADALLAFDAVLVADPENVSARLSRAGALAELGRDVESKAEHDRAFGMDPTGEIAGDYFTGAIARNERSAWARVGRGLALATADRVDDAIADFEAAIEIDPENDLAVFNLGATLADAGDLEAALPYFDWAINLDPNSAYHWAVRGSTLLAMGDDAGAAGDFEAAIAIDPRNPWIYTFRAQGLVELDEPEAALEDLDLAVELEPENPAHRSDRAHVRWSVDDVDGAVDDLDALLLADPGDVDALRLRGEIARHVEDFDAAFHFLDRALDADPTGGRIETLAERALTHADVGDAIEAERDLRFAQALAVGDESHEEAVAELAELLEDVIKG